MYTIGEAFREMLGPEGKNRTIAWHGTMTTEAGTVYNINTDTISPGSGTLESVCELPCIGGAFSTSLRVQLNLRDVDPETLKGARIELFAGLIYQINSWTTWGELEKFTWGELSSITWGGDARAIREELPMGIFYVTNADRVLYSIKLEAYDGMLKFNTDLPAMDAVSRSAFAWARWICAGCGVELGMSAEQVKALPNGSRSFVYADVDSGVKTYRDLLGKLAAALGAVALMDRAGRLVLVCMGREPVAEITPSDRFSSEYEDTRSRYTGLTAHYKAQAVNEYYKNVSATEDGGLVIDLGANPFLQMTNNSARTAALQEIIDSMAGVYFTPFTASIPSHPEFDLLDVLSFTGGHAPENCQGPITGITRKINGGVTVQCATPPEQDDPIRGETDSDGLSSSGGTAYASTDFWIQMDAFPDAETTVTEETVTTEVKVTCTADNTDMQIAWTAVYSLDAAARVTARVLVDEVEIYAAMDDQTVGNHVLNVTTGHRVTQKGEHLIQVTLQEELL